jgi:MFS family permease
MFSLALVIELGTLRLLPVVLIYPLLVVARSLFALLGSGTGPASQAYVAERTSREDRTAGVALVSAAMGVGETIGPGVGALLARVDLLAPLYLSAGLAVLSSFTIRRYLPEDGPPVRHDQPRPARLRVLDPRVLPFVLVSASLQAVRATTAITLAFFLQDRLGLNAAQTVQYSGLGFVTLAVSGLLSQLVLVQRFRPGPRLMLRAGVPLTIAAFLCFCLGHSYAAFLAGLVLLGVGLGLLRPGSAAGASLAVEANEQGAVAGLVNGVAVLGNVFGPMIGTTLYELSPIGPYVLNASIMAAAWVLVFANRRLRTLRA